MKLLFIIVVAICLGFMFVSSVKEIAENAYMEGQKDYMHGDIRIKQVSHDNYEWIKSPWDDENEEK